MEKIVFITRYFPLWVISLSLLSLYNPTIFIWFSGDMITYGLAGIMLAMGLTLKISDFKQILKNNDFLFEMCLNLFYFCFVDF